MVRAQLDEEAIFKIAVELSQPETRAEYLNQVCAEEPMLLNRVQKLLDAHFEAPHYLESELPGIAATFDLPTDDSVGQHNAGVRFAGSYAAGEQIGPYKIREQIGEGGMGLVYVAEQTEPVRRKLALKIIKPGMATREVLARFDAERQSLALMEHPHIARVIDGGATESGLPFFVMELVQGSPVTEYCDKHQMTTQERLRLFIKICRAVQHAHQKGIIHRDLKPSNVLVAEIDDEAVPKVIDFGIAKAVDQNLSDQTVYTHFAQVVGTPLYMSPEQAGQGVIDVDTRSDVYSLGVMLYELLTGRTPFDVETLKAAGVEEMRRIIREQEPTKPSAMVSTLNAQALSTVAERRDGDGRKLSDLLKGELDWIVMRALEKDRSRRYETASAFAMDIERYLNQEPIAAGPPSMAYKTKKYVQRNRGWLLTASLITAICMAGIVFVVGAKLQADRVRWQIGQEVEQSLSAAQSAIETGDLDVARQRIGIAEGRFAAAGDRLPELADRVLHLKTEIDERRSQQERFKRFQQLARQGMDGMSYGEDEDPVQSAKQALELFGVLGDNDWVARLRNSYLSEPQQSTVLQTAYETLLVLADNGIRWERKGGNVEKKENAPASLLLLERAKTFHAPTRAFYWVRAECYRLLENEEQGRFNDQLFDTTAATTAFDYYLPGHTAGWRGDLEAAISSYEAALRLQPDHFNSLFFLSLRLSRVGRTAEAAQVFRACRILRPNDFIVERNAAFHLRNSGQSEQALGLLSDLLAVAKQSESADRIADLLRMMADTYRLTGRYKDAVAAYENALEVSHEIRKGTAANLYNNYAWFLASCPDPVFQDAQHAVRLATQAIELEPGNAHIWSTLGVAQYRAGDCESAIASLKKSTDHTLSSYNSFFLAMCNSQLGERSQAKEWYDKAVQWMKDNNSTDEELLRFRKEAEQTLSIQQSVSPSPPDPLSTSADHQRETTSSIPIQESNDPTKPLDKNKKTSLESETGR